MKKLILLLLLLTGCTQVPEDLQVIFANVSQGSATILLTQNNTVLYDCGPNFDYLIDDLTKFNLTKIDLLIVSHPDKDHIGGCAELIKNFEVERIVDNGELKKTKVFQEYQNARNTISEYQTIISDTNDPKFQFINYLVAYDSQGFLDEKSNENSINLKIGKEVLLMGDCERKCEKILQKTSNLKAKVLLVGHHGSKTSSNNYFLKEVKPEIAIISSGKNHYGHPHNETINRLYQHTNKIFRTDEGTIVLGIHP
jgi:competence protein ComEC